MTPRKAISESATPVFALALVCSAGLLFSFLDTGAKYLVLSGMAAPFVSWMRFAVHVLLVLVLLRGWLYSPDARTVDLVPAREGDTLSVEALVTSFPPPRLGGVRSPTSANAVRALDHDTLSAMMRRPLAPAVLLALGDTVSKDIALVTRIPPPSQSEGPHFSYAMQWFGFATVFIVGFLAFARSGRPPRTPPSS